MIKIDIFDKLEKDLLNDITYSPDSTRKNIQITIQKYRLENQRRGETTHGANKLSAGKINR